MSNMRTFAPSDFTLEDLLPHRETMLLIGEVLTVDTLHAVTLSTVKESWPLVDQYGAEPLILVELAAQTAGVCNGWERVSKQGLDSDRMGWLVAVKRADFFIDRLAVGSTIRTRAENTFVFDKFREVTSRLHQDDRLIASVVLQLYQP